MERLFSMEKLRCHKCFPNSDIMWISDLNQSYLCVGQMTFDLDTVFSKWKIKTIGEKTLMAFLDDIRGLGYVLYDRMLKLVT